MNVALMLMGSGGWPLNVIMTPDKNRSVRRDLHSRQSLWAKVCWS